MRRTERVDAVYAIVTDDGAVHGRIVSQDPDKVVIEIASGERRIIERN